MAPAPSTGIGIRVTKEGVTKRGGGWNLQYKGWLLFQLLSVQLAPTMHDGFLLMYFVPSGLCWPRGSGLTGKGY